MEQLAVPILGDVYDIQDTASYILNRGYTRVALQFPDHLLKVSVMVSSALRNEVKRQGQGSAPVQLYVLADTTYGSCCGDEIAAAHVNAQCIIHYGHTCLSQMSRLPIWYVFGKAIIDFEDCAQQLVEHGSRCKQNLLVLFDLQYTYAIPNIKESTYKAETLFSGHRVDILFAEIPDRAMDPQEISHGNEQAKDSVTGYGMVQTRTCEREKGGGCCLDTHIVDTEQVKEVSMTCGCKEQQNWEALTTETREAQQFNAEETNRYSLGGLRWTIPAHSTMEDTLIVWLGPEGPALTNIMLTYNATAVVRYDPDEKSLLTDVANQSKLLRRRYYLVERAKDANIIGIVIGTLGVVGFQEVICKIKRLVKEAGKKSYTLAMGKPNPAKLANFPECDIFVLVACAETALLESKEFMAPVITPFEAVIAWERGSQWTGTYSLDFRLLMEKQDLDTKIDQEKIGSVQPGECEEARFSFIKGGYIEGDPIKEPDQSSRALILSREAEQALQLQAVRNSELAIRKEAKSGVEYFASRSYQGLEVDNTSKPVPQYVLGRKGRASAYNGELVEKAG